MNELDVMLQAPAEAALPLLVRNCKKHMETGDQIEIELYRPDPEGGYTHTELIIHRRHQGQAQEPIQVEWDDGVNIGLMNLGIRTVNLKQEGERFSLGIRAALRKVERRYGDGFLNSVLVDLLNESDLCKGGEIAEVLKFVNIPPPKRGGGYHACRELVANEIGGRAVELRDKLKYKPDEIKAVMMTALAIYLDERFSISSRRYFGKL